MRPGECDGAGRGFGSGPAHKPTSPARWRYRGDGGLSWNHIQMHARGCVQVRRRDLFGHQGLGELDE